MTASVSYCYITNNPIIRWLKINFILQDADRLGVSVLGNVACLSGLGLGPQCGVDLGLFHRLFLLGPSLKGQQTKGSFSDVDCRDAGGLAQGCLCHV